MNNIVESFNTQNGTKKEIVMCQSASLSLGLSPKDYEEFEITHDEKKGTVSWNKKGQEQSITWWLASSVTRWLRRWKETA